MHLVNGYNPWIVNIAYRNCPFLCVPSKTFLSGQNQSEKFLWQLLKAIIRAVKHKFDLEIVLKECGATEAVGDSCKQSAKLPRPQVGGLCAVSWSLFAVE